ncbi:MAG: hypothetical protein R2809_10135 [Flavobacteriales bacterium]
MRAIPVTAGQYEVELLTGELPSISCFGSWNSTEYANWYIYTPEQDASLTVNSDADSLTLLRLSIYSGTCGALICGPMMIQEVASLPY